MFLSEEVVYEKAQVLKKKKEVVIRNDKSSPCSAEYAEKWLSGGCRSKQRPYNEGTRSQVGTWFVLRARKSQESLLSKILTTNPNQNPPWK